MFISAFIAFPRPGNRTPEPRSCSRSARSRLGGVSIADLWGVRYLVALSRGGDDIEGEAGPGSAVLPLLVQKS